MPLPTGIGSADHEKREPSNLAAPPQRPHAIPRAIRCSHCKKVGIAFFDKGFNVKTADRVMNGRPIIGDCGYCKWTGIELIPIPDLTPSDEKDLYHLYKIQETLQYAAERNIPIPKKFLALPLKKLEEFQRKWEKQ